MLLKVAYCWRLFATGVSFVVFGVASLLLGLVVFPALRVAGGGAIATRTRIRWTLALAIRCYLRALRLAGVMSFEFRGVERLGRSQQIIMANHPTLIDFMFLMAFVPDVTCVAKGALWDNPYTRWPLLAAGHVRNAPTDVMIAGASAALAGGQSVLIFPQGTRTVPGQPLHFHRGAAAIAIRAAAVVTPVFIRCEPPTLAKGDPWYRIPARRAHFSLWVGDDIVVDGFRGCEAPTLAARRLNAHLLEIFSAQLAADRT